MAAGFFNTVISSVSWRNDTAAGTLLIEKMSDGQYRFIDVDEPNGYVYIKDEPDGKFQKLWDLLEALT